MSRMKQFAEEVSVDMGKDGEIDDEVLIEAQKRLESPAKPAYGNLARLWCQFVHRWYAWHSLRWRTVSYKEAGEGRSPEADRVCFSCDREWTEVRQP